jgi:hypothetical protein
MILSSALYPYAASIYDLPLMKNREERRREREEVEGPYKIKRELKLYLFRSLFLFL